jgi:hypothetical protein
VRTVPAVRELHRRYTDRGLLVIGVHSPESDPEREVTSVRRAIARLDIPYRVALDNDFRLWKAFGNRHWPATYLVGRDGQILWHHVGELHLGTTAWREGVSRIERALGGR